VNFSDPQALAQACADSMWADDASSQALGMAIEQIAPGQARLAMMIGAQMVNGHGICHGGYVFILADSAFAFACNTYNERNVAQHCSVSFIRPARLGMRLVAVAQERQRAGRSGIYDVTVTAEDGAPVAEFRGHSRALGRKFFEEPAS
jgi:acyl-CoA thioesterase